jgi:digeranylgeranylglycerophospholipid reductase
MISVIGAGPVGSYVAGLLAEKGEEVNLYEEHSGIGKPVQCTGILTGDFNKLVKVDKSFLVNKIKRVRVHSSHNSVDFRLRNENYVFSREKFDKFMCENAVEKGARLFLKHKFIGAKLGKKIKIKFENGSSIESDYLVGADGPRSEVAKLINERKRKFTIALQANVRGKYEKDLVDFYIGEKHFGWVVPENEEVARVGVTSYNNTKRYFDDLMKGRGKVLSLLGGVIPVYDPKFLTQKENVFLAGDAAGHVKTSTHGGIIPGMIGGSKIVDAIQNKKDYAKLWKREIGKDLLIHLWIRKIMDNFSEKDCDDLVEYCKDRNLNKLIEDFDREFPSKYLLKAAFLKPQLLKYCAKMIM